MSSKISDLAALGSGLVATGDLFCVVDISDTSMAASGTDKKVTFASLMASTSDSTIATSLLTAIKTVDGAGSGLDADLLDGLSSAAFALASHTHPASDIASGTIATARLGSGTANNTTYLRGDQSYATPAGGSPGGSDTYVQYNNSGAFGGDSQLTYSPGALRLSANEFPVLSIVGHDSAYIFMTVNNDHTATINVFYGGLVAPLHTARLDVSVGTSTSFAKIGGTIFDVHVDAGNSGTSETDLVSYTTPANCFGTNDDKVVAEFSGTLAGIVTTTPELKIKFAGTTIFDINTLAAGTNGDFELWVTIIRVSATVVRYNIAAQVNGITTQLVKSNELTGLTLSATNILKLTGQSTGTGAATNDIVAKMAHIEWKPAGA